MLMPPDEDRPPSRGQEQEQQSRQPSRERPRSREMIEQRPPSRGEVKASADFEEAYSEAFDEDDVASYAADDDFSDSGPGRDIGGERMDNEIKDEVTEIFEVEQPLREAVSERDESILEVPIFPDPPADALLKTEPEKEDAYEDDDFEDED